MVIPGAARTVVGGRGEGVAVGVFFTQQAVGLPCQQPDGAWRKLSQFNGQPTNSTGP